MEMKINTPNFPFCDMEINTLNRRLSNSLAIKYKYCRLIGNNKVLPHSAAQLFPKPFLPAVTRQCLRDLPSNKREVHRAEEAREEKLLMLSHPAQVYIWKTSRHQRFSWQPSAPNAQIEEVIFLIYLSEILQTTQERGLTWLPCPDLRRIPPLFSDQKNHQRPPK